MKLWITTGLTGGHLYPALALGEHLQKKYPDYRIRYFAPQRLEEKKELLKAFSRKEVVLLRDTPWRGFGWSVIQPILKNFQTIKELFLKEKPDGVVAFGSGLAVSVVITAFFFRIPVLIHEQNVVYGKANRFLAFLATGIALSFLETDRRKKCFYTGNLLRSFLLEKAEPRDDLMKAGVLNVLVLGGSQGARFLNEILLQLIQKLSPEFLVRFRIVLITGNSPDREMVDQLKKIGPFIETHPFYDDMALLYQKADLLIARAGAGTIFEALLFGLPAIYVPYPHASSHQRANAISIENAGAAWVVDQNEAALIKLYQIFQLLLGPAGKKTLSEKSQAAQKIQKKDGCEIIERWLLEHLKK